MTWSPSPEKFELDRPKRTPWKSTLLLAIVGLLLVWALTGCTKEKKDEFCGSMNDGETTRDECISTFMIPFEIRDLKDKISKLESSEAKLQQLEDYLQIVEWTEPEIMQVYKTEPGENIIPSKIIREEKTYYTKDKDRVEYVKLGCENGSRLEPGICPKHDETCYVKLYPDYQRCQFLKSKLGL